LNRNIHAVLFDFDGTLVFQEPDSIDLICAFCAEIGQPINAQAERHGRRAQHYYFADASLRQQRLALSRERFWHHFNRHLLQALGIEGDLDGLAEQVAQRFAETEFQHYCPANSYHTLTELRARGYALGLITNRDNVDRLYELLAEVGLGSHLDMILASGEVGTRKPEPEIFDMALQRIGTAADQAVYVGDNYWADVVGAHRAGLLPALLDPCSLFPEAECRVVERLDEILEWLPRRPLG
jgi:putative hydrolase of the HAD superfamily